MKREENPKMAKLLLLIASPDRASDHIAATRRSLLIIAHVIMCILVTRLLCRLSKCLITCSNSKLANFCQRTSMSKAKCLRTFQ